MGLITDEHDVRALITIARFVLQNFNPMAYFYPNLISHFFSRTINNTRPIIIRLIKLL